MKGKVYIISKRALDIILAIIGLILSSPLSLFAIILIKLDDGGSVIYKSRRMGKDLKPFDVYKFRTMRENRVEMQSKLKHDEMVTKAGAFLRRTSIDEIPQMINILKGEMSFIGPRPWIVEYYNWFTEDEKRRVSVLPGITGLAQANGRNGITILQKLQYDLEYVDNMSFKMDFKVLMLTVKTVLSKESAEISEQGIKEEISTLKSIAQATNRLKQTGREIQPEVIKIENKHILNM